MALAGLSLGADTAHSADAKPLFASKVVTAETAGHAVDIDVDLAGAKQLYLVAADGGDGFSCDWADWAEPRVVTKDGEQKLTELKWKSASSEWGKVHMNQNADGRPLRIAGKEVSYGIGTHANSVIVFDLPAGATRFKARGGLVNGGTDQGGGSTVQFMVFAEKPPASLFAKSRSRSAGNDAEQRKPENAVAGLDVYEGLEATLFASEPMLTNPTNIDIDARGRIWVCDVANYRSHNGERPEGDRILILEDTDHDGKADKSTVFYQGKDLISPQGICVLGSKVIVSASPNVWVFTDENGDDKPEKKEALFTHTGDPQHDHSVHSFVFGPDGKLYFNMGNASSKVCDKDGNVVVDKAGNRVEATGKPYRQGMVFRCNLDGSQFETLAWNFRNNYEMCVDSFGNIWQSDNDDDGNKSVRINYVMEGGNYGYTDEMTGAGWQSPRTNMEKDIPRRHWHQNDPGVVPNVLITGAGAPSGITVYEGDLLPEVFRGNVLHCEPGQNSMRCYVMKPDGAGFKCAETIEILKGRRDNWFRPADVCVAPDGSVFVSDWYDPGVGGHAQGDTTRGRIFRVAPKGKKYEVPKVDVSAPQQIIGSLISPTESVRYEAFQAAQKQIAENGFLSLLKFDGELKQGVAKSVQLLPRLFWLNALQHRDGRATAQGTSEPEPIVSPSDFRSIHQALAQARLRGEGKLLETLEAVRSSDLRVLAVCAVQLRSINSTTKSANTWATLAALYDGRDRWYLEALGIGAGKNWDACLDAWLERVGDKWNTPAGHDIIWRSRAKKTPDYLAKIILDTNTPTDELPKFLRAFDFQSGPEKNAALVRLAFAGISDSDRRKLVSTEALKRLGGNFDINRDPKTQSALRAILDDVRGTSQFVDLVSRFRVQTRYPELLEIAQKNADGQLGLEAMQALLKTSEGPELIERGLVSGDIPTAVATATAVGNAANAATTPILLRAISDVSRHIEVRKAAARALAKTPDGAKELLKALEAKSIPTEVGAGAAFALNASTVPEVRAAAAKLFPPPPSRDSKPLPAIAELVKARGSAERGQKLFISTATCAKCHTVGKEGKDVGPALSEIGDKLSRQAMFESILYPSAGIAHNYETYAVRLQDGSIVTGLLVSRTPEAISIKGDDALVRTFKTDEVDDVKKHDLSLMPADLQKLMTADELIDVVEYLATLKKKG
jgi:putative membrane-bound dehydrogenase-like protein